MYALITLAAIPAVMWLVQTLMLVALGEPVRARIGGRNLPKSVKRVGRIVTNTTLASVLLIYPLLRGTSPWTYYAAFLPLNERTADVGLGVAAAVLYLTLLYLAWMLSGNVTFAPRHDARRIVRHLLSVPLTAVLAAFLEELLFRAVLLNDLLATWSTPVAVGVAALIFASAHYVRDVKRRWTFPGHIALGLLFCVAFVAAERTLWLPFGLHAGGILVLMGVRPFVRYTGPPWLVGASIFPYAGVPGIVALGLLTLNVCLLVGGCR